MIGKYRDRRWVFVDVETTGASPARERVTEVGVVTVDTDGDAQRVSEWSTLVNPGVPIPAEIQWLTGITNEMVRDAPPFADIAETLYDRLSEAVFVAHNARFDHGFLKSEFARVGVDWRAATLCTVRLSRLLYPDRGPHSLDAIVARFGLDGEQRHRALGDARVLWRLLQRLLERHGVAEIELAVDRLLARSSEILEGVEAGLAPIEISVDDAMLTALVLRFDLINERGLLVGDAAGAVSPMTAGGLDPCLRQSALAVDVISEFLRDRSAASLSRYASAPFRKRFRARSLMRRGLAAIQHPGVAELGFALLRLPPFTSVARHVFFGRGSFPMSDRVLQACPEFRAI